MTPVKQISAVSRGVAGTGLAVRLVTDIHNADEMQIIT